MVNIQDKIGETSQPTGGGMRRVLADGSESMSELREFMGQMRGKSPHEVLGAVASSGLIQSTLVAAIAFTVVLVGLSVVVHYLDPDKESATAAPAKSPQKTDSAPAVTAPQPNTSVADGQATKPANTVKSGDKTLDNLGISETKQTDPTKNPLEASLDNLLDDAK